MQQLFQLLQAIYPMSEDMILYLSKAFEYRKIRKGEFLLKQGQVSRYLFFIERGLVRSFHQQGNKEVVTWFKTEGHVVLVYESYYEEAPSMESIEALEDCEIYRITHANLQHVYDTYPESNYLGRVLTEKYYCMLWKVFHYTKLTSATERYQYFIEHFPQWVNRVPEKDIAAFLGVTPSHFSRSKRG